MRTLQYTIVGIPIQQREAFQADVVRGAVRAARACHTDVVDCMLQLHARLHDPGVGI